MDKRNINKVAIIGSGIMGSSIACHFANIGIPVLLYDIVPSSLLPEEEKMNLKLTDKKVRYRIVTQQFQHTIQSKPSPIYSKKFTDRISLCNLEDDLEKLKSVDWIMEVVVEKLDIKKSLFDKIEKYILPHTLITSNTSGIPIHLMLEGRTQDFKDKFCGTHFFNPPRYLPLLEIIPTPSTKKEIIDFLMDFGYKFLGKKTILAKDTPAFIANRIGVFSILQLFHSIGQFNFSIDDIDKLTGTLIGRPKSATFRTADVVGIDTLVHVANGLANAPINDEAKNIFELPVFLKKMLENNWLGAKTGQGFYKKTNDANGKSEILSLNLKTLDYEPAVKSKFDIFEKVKNENDAAKKWQLLSQDKGDVGKFFRQSLASVFSYSACRIPEIADHYYQIDDAMRAGFGWSQGPFEIWEMVGIKNGLEWINEQKLALPNWVVDFEKNNIHFYNLNENEELCAFDISKQNFAKIPNAPIILNRIKESKVLWSNKSSRVLDLGDGILNFDFYSKMNTIDGDVLSGLNKAIELAEKNYEGLVVSNQGDNFSVGANIGMIFMMAAEQEWDDLNMAVKYFQDTNMRLRYSSIPTVVVPYNMTFGGGCEMSIHADKVVAHSETYMGLVEMGIGVIPGGGGTKEMTKRAAEHFMKGDVELNVLQEYFMTIAQTKVSTSAQELYDLFYLKKDKDAIVVNKERLISEAKNTALRMAQSGYVKPIKENNIKVLGKEAIAMFLVGVDSMLAGNFITEHDAKCANKLAYVMAGGNLSEAAYVSEQYLLDLEREAFLSLCGERKTLERIQYMLQKGKPLRN